MTTIGTKILVAKWYSRKVWPLCLAMAIQAVVIDKWSLRWGNFMLASHNQVSGEAGRKLQTSGPTGWGRKQQCGWGCCRECVRALEFFGFAAPKSRGSQVFLSWDWKSSMAENSTSILPWEVFSPASRVERTSSCFRGLAEKVPCQNPSRNLCRNQSVQKSAHIQIAVACQEDSLSSLCVGWQGPCQNPSLNAEIQTSAASLLFLEAGQKSSGSRESSGC